MHNVGWLGQSRYYYVINTTDDPILIWVLQKIMDFCTNALGETPAFLFSHEYSLLKTVCFSTFVYIFPH